MGLYPSGCRMLRSSLGGTTKSATETPCNTDTVSPAGLISVRRDTNIPVITFVFTCIWQDILQMP